jgi:hypothetical protein
MVVLFIPAHFIRESGIKLSYNINLLLIAILAIGVYILISKLTTGRAEIKIDSTQLSFLWIKKPIITLQKNTAIELDNISAWKYHQGHQYDYFKIYTKNEGELIFYPKSNWNKTDEFDLFLDAFKNKIIEYNEEEVFTKNDESFKKTRIIDKEQEYHNSHFATFMFYIYILTIIFCIIVLPSKWDNLNGAQPLIIISGLFGCIFLIIQHLQKKNKL